MLLSVLDFLTQVVCSGLRQSSHGVGVDSAATLLTAAGDNPERFRSDAGCTVSQEPDISFLRFLPRSCHIAIIA